MSFLLGPSTEASVISLAQDHGQDVVNQMSYDTLLAVYPPQGTLEEIGMLGPSNDDFYGIVAFRYSHFYLLDILCKLVGAMV